MTDYRSGDTVRVTIEAMVEGHHIKYVQLPKSPDIDYLSEFHTVEVIKRATPPEPTEPGTVVLTRYENDPPQVAIRVFPGGFPWERSGHDGASTWEEVVSGSISLKVILPGGEA